MIIVAAPALAMSTPIRHSSFELPVTFGVAGGGGGGDGGSVVVGFSMAGDGVLTNGKGFGGADIVECVVGWTGLSRGPACAVTLTRNM
jgi:hypothetical protein